MVNDIINMNLKTQQRIFLIRFERTQNCLIERFESFWLCCVEVEVAVARYFPL